MKKGNSIIILALVVIDLNLESKIYKSKPVLRIAGAVAWRLKSLPILFSLDQVRHLNFLDV